MHKVESRPSSRPSEPFLPGDRSPAAASRGYERTMAKGRSAGRSISRCLADRAEREKATDEDRSSRRSLAQFRGADAKKAQSSKCPMAEACGSRTHPGRRSRPTRGFEDREGHRAPCASRRRHPIVGQWKTSVAWWVSRASASLTVLVTACQNARTLRGCSSAGRAHDWQS